MEGVALHVRHQRDDEEERGEEEDERREAERVAGDHPEDEVDGRAGGAECDREDRRDPETPSGVHVRPRGGVSRLAITTRSAPRMANAAPTITPRASGPPPRARVRTIITMPRTQMITPTARVDSL